MILPSSYPSSAMQRKPSTRTFGRDTGQGALSALASFKGIPVSCFRRYHYWSHPICCLDIVFRSSGELPKPLIVGAVKQDPQIKQEVPATGPAIKQEMAATGPEVNEEMAAKVEHAGEAGVSNVQASLAALVAQLQSSTPADQLVDVLAKAILKHAAPAPLLPQSPVPTTLQVLAPPPKPASLCQMVAEPSPPAKAASPAGPAINPGPVPASQIQRVNSNTFPAEYKSFERFCERNPHADELRRAYAPEPQYWP